MATLPTTVAQSTRMKKLHIGAWTLLFGRVTQAMMRLTCRITSTATRPSQM